MQVSDPSTDDSTILKADSSGSSLFDSDTLNSYEATINSADLNS